MEHAYKFTDFDWLANMSGFDKPTDVYYGTVLLGVIVSAPDGYVIERVMVPKGGSAKVSKSRNNKFKSKLDAAKILHNLWKLQRKI